MKIILIILIPALHYIGSSPQKTGVVVEVRSKNSKSFALLLELLFRGYNDALGRQEARQANLGRLPQGRRDLWGELPLYA